MFLSFISEESTQIVDYLLRHLELSRFNHAAAFIAKLIDVNSTAEISKVYAHAFGHVGLLIHFSSQNGIENLHGIPSFVILLKIECNNRRSRVGVEADKRRLPTR